MAKFNRNLISIISILVIIVAASLAITADRTNNWRGFIISLIHTLTVAIGTFLALKRNKDDALKENEYSETIAVKN